LKKEFISEVEKEFKKVLSLWVYQLKIQHSIKLMRLFL
jgi:hypothetical protein